ncbi:LITAF domain-containing protein-like [Crassostrea angulata]|uniref:LITAF domain-containing protein n=1 Tax=Magallana gigas TaxID=29159 RepID=UPI0022B1521A|nr:LITAF domain-containing protein-like [Crassostrea angulata]
MNQPPPPPSYVAPGQGQPPPPPGGTQIVYTHQPTALSAVNFNQYPVAMKCHYCQASITTSTNYEAGALTWVACFVIAFIGCWCGCCFIPFCLNDLKDVTHNCPNCRQTLGKFSKMK